MIDIEDLKKCLKKYKICRQIASIPLHIFYSYLKIKTILISDRKFVKNAYKKVFGKFPNLKNPQTLNEFIAYRKVYQRDPIFTKCADKFEVREYIKDKIGEEYLIPLITYSDDITKIDFNSLPKSFAIKVNHGSGQNMIIRDKDKEDLKEIAIHVGYWMKRNHYYNTREWQYKDIKTLVLFEELILDEDNNIPKDYKFHMINGEVEFIQVDVDRYKEHKRIFYTKEWKELDFMWAPLIDNKLKYQRATPQTKPKNLDHMIHLAKKLSQDFCYVRVDLYDVGNRVYFGELTFTHEDGLSKFFPDKYDQIYGKKISLPTAK